LERLGRERRRQEVPPMPEGWYPHEPRDPFYELDWVFLHEHLARIAAVVGDRLRLAPDWRVDVIQDRAQTSAGAR
jgi:hypothetical protein